MTWVYIALAVVAALAALFLLSAYLLRFRLILDVDFPSAQGNFEVTFPGFRRAFPFGRKADGASGGEAVSVESPQNPAAPAGGQAGFLRVDLSRAALRRRLHALERRLRRASKRWILDLAVWRIVAGYVRRSAFRLVRVFRFGLEYLHVGAEDPAALGRFAGLWSVSRGMFPGLRGPVEYAFNQPFTLRSRVTARCTGLGLLALAASLLFTFPWLPLARRFAYCWRHPRLARWQRRLLLS